MKEHWLKVFSRILVSWHIKISILFVRRKFCMNSCFGTSSLVWPWQFMVAMVMVYILNCLKFISSFLVHCSNRQIYSWFSTLAFWCAWLVFVSSCPRGRFFLGWPILMSRLNFLFQECFIWLSILSRVDCWWSVRLSLVTVGKIMAGSMLIFPSSSVLKSVSFFILHRVFLP